MFTYDYERKEKTSGTLLALLNFPRSIPLYFSRLLPSFLPDRILHPTPHTCFIALFLVSLRQQKQSEKKVHIPPAVSLLGPPI